MRFKIQELIDDLGGAPALAHRLNVCRTIPYGWVRRNFISSTYLSKIKEIAPLLDLNSYFSSENTDENHAKRSLGTTGSRVGSDTHSTGDEKTGGQVGQILR
jgi:hypothetical protein